MPGLTNLPPALIQVWLNSIPVALLLTLLAGVVFSRLTSLPAVWRYRGWWLVLALVLLAGTVRPFLTAAGLPGWPEARKAGTGLTNFPAAAVTWNPATGHLCSAAAPAAASNADEPDVVSHSKPVFRFLPLQLPAGQWITLVCLIWLAVALLLMARLGRGLLGLTALKQMARPFPEPESAYWNARLHSAGINRPCRFGFSGQIRIPLLAGLRDPWILIPAELKDQLNSRQLEAVILHEAAHLSRRDDWAQAGRRLLSALFWPHPAIHWINRHIEDEQEFCCDDWVVTVTGRRRSYAACLSHLAELVSESPSRLPAPGAYQSRPAIFRRIHMIIQPAKSKRPPLIRTALLLAAGLLSVLLLAGPAWVALARPVPPDRAVPAPPMRTPAIPAAVAVPAPQPAETATSALPPARRERTGRPQAARAATARDGSRNISRQREALRHKIVRLERDVQRTRRQLELLSGEPAGYPLAPVPGVPGLEPGLTAPAIPLPVAVAAAEPGLPVPEVVPEPRPAAIPAAIAPVAQPPAGPAPVAVPATAPAPLGDVTVASPSNHAGPAAVPQPVTSPRPLSPQTRRIRRVPPPPPAPPAPPVPPAVPDEPPPAAEAGTASPAAIPPVPPVAPAPPAPSTAPGQTPPSPAAAINPPARLVMPAPPPPPAPPSPPAPPKDKPAKKQ